MIFSTFSNFVKKNQNILGVSFLTFLSHFSMSEKVVFGGFCQFLAHFSEEEPGYLRSFFWQFLAHFSISNKTQDLLGGFVQIFSPFFNSVNKT